MSLPTVKTALSRHLNSIGYRVDKDHGEKVRLWQLLIGKCGTMAETKSTDDYFWTIKEAARYLGISAYTLRAYLNHNKKNLPPICYPATKQVRFPKDEFKEWARQQRG